MGGMIRCEGGEREGKEGRGDKTIGRARPLARPLDHDKNKTGSPRAGGKFCVLGEMYHRDGCLHDGITMGGRSFCSQIPTWREDENAIRFRQTCRGPSRLRIDARIAAPLSSKLAYDLGRGLRETWVVASAAHRTWPRTSTPKAASVFSLSHLARCAGSERTGQRSQNCPFFARRQLGVGDHATHRVYIVNQRGHHP